MSTTMRTTTLQTVPESLPADHVTNSVASAPAPAVPETKTHHSTTSSTALKTRSSSSAAKVRTHNFIWAARILAMDTISKMLCNLGFRSLATDFVILSNQITITSF